MESFWKNKDVKKGPKKQSTHALVILEIMQQLMRCRISIPPQLISFGQFKKEMQIWKNSINDDMLINDIISKLDFRKVLGKWKFLVLQMLLNLGTFSSYFSLVTKWMLHHYLKGF